MTSDCIHARGSGIFIEPDASFGRRCVCVRVCRVGGTFKFKFSHPLSLPAREIVNSGRHLCYQTIVCFSQFHKGSVLWERQGAGVSSIDDKESHRTPDLPARCKRKCSSPLGKGEVSVRNFLHRAFHHTYRCVAGGKLRLPQTC